MENVEEIFDRKCIDEGWRFDNPKARKFIYECMQEAQKQAPTKSVVINPNCDCDKVDGKCCNFLCENFHPQ